MSSLTAAHATNAVNALLQSVLPGSASVNAERKKTSRDKGSKAQLIDRNLKKRVEVQEKDVYRIKKREKKMLRKKISGRKEVQEDIEQKAKLQVLRKHQLDNSLTDHEKSYLDKVVKKNVRNLKSWDYDDKEELLDLQKQILANSEDSKKVRKVKSRRQKKKQFKENLPQSIQDHRYKALTPGLAPVGASDEEESEDEDEDY
ncbi:Rrt14 [Kluyveromyces lactis]|nr:Rrt14 [Kluyveromyces lactis]